MPIYEYQCKACAAVFEVLQTVQKQPTISCSNCGSTNVKRILSPAAVLVQTGKQAAGQTCCGREERCEMPPCSLNGACHKR